MFKYFNRIVALFFLLGSSILLRAQSKEQDIQTIMKLIHINETMGIMVENSIAIYKKKYPYTQQKVWDEIKASVNYSKYSKKIFGIFDNSYTQPELKVLLQQAATIPSSKLRLKKNVQNELFRTGNEFGIEVAKIIQKKFP